MGQRLEWQPRHIPLVPSLLLLLLAISENLLYVAHKFQAADRDDEGSNALPATRGRRVWGRGKWQAQRLRQINIYLGEADEATTTGC